MTMRDFSCFRDGAVTLSTAAAAATVGAGAALDRSLQAATASIYKAALSSRKEVVVRVTWTRTTVTVGAAGGGGGAAGLSVAVEDVPPKLPLAAWLGPGPGPGPAAAAAAASTPRRSSAALMMPASAQQFLQKKRGSRSFVTEAGTVVAIYWDTTDAKYPAAVGFSSSSSPEPSGGYYLAVIADAELALLLGGGDAARELSRRFAAAPRRALLSRREQLRAPPSPAPAAAALAHSTRCRFRDDGAEHEVTVVCRGGEWGSRDDGELAVSVDGKKVVEARRVKWNFRGNRTAVLGDGAVVEVMWDVHDWWFAGGGGGGAAQFMVKARGVADGGGRVWMDEEMAKMGQPPAGFFLHMQCYRR